MPVHIFKNPDEFSHAVARWITDLISTTLKKKDRFSFVLSGGNTPKALFHLLAHSPYREEIDWTKLHIFWGDERAVPFSDERNNARMAFDALLSHVNVPASQIHVIRTDIPPLQSATDYEKILRVYFDSSPSATESDSFDLVLLGMGDDGHTLSLFPGTQVIHEEKTWVAAYFLQAQDMYRITLTKSIVNRSVQIAFLTTGSSKAQALKKVIEGGYNPDLYPAQVIKPVHGELHWFLDESAASLLDKNTRSC